MDRNVGLWIDHKQAFAIWHADGKVEVFTSQIEPPAHFSGGTRLGGRQTSKADAEPRRNDRFRLQLNKFYQQVISALKGADSILIMGPGEAKVEFEKVIKKNKEMQRRILKVETTAKMTKNQMVAYVKNFYKNRKIT
jgi:stalled ribosome rescue protein Dom34